MCYYTKCTLSFVLLEKIGSKYKSNQGISIDKSIYLIMLFKLSRDEYNVCVWHGEGQFSDDSGGIKYKWNN